jgi:hypothetical protein
VILALMMLAGFAAPAARKPVQVEAPAPSDARR